MTEDKAASKNLKSGYVKEETPYTRKELEAIFKCKETDFANIIRQLRYKKILKINQSNKATDDMSDMADEVIDVTDAIADINGYRYTFTYVGIIIIGGFVLKCYPKYIEEADEKNLLNKFKQVLRVLEKHNSNSTDIRMLSDDVSEKGFNLLEVILYLLHDYYEHGIYFNHKSIIESNGTGAILWDRTVNQVQPLIVNNRPYYTELLTRKRVDEQENYFRRLHECILTECSKTFADHDLFELFDDLSPIELTDTVLDDFGDTDYILYRIERELGEQFNTRKQQLLKAMHTYIDSKKGVYENVALSVHGTTSFNLVWEQVCAKVMHNNLHDELGELSKGCLGTLHADYEKHKKDKLISIIAKPQWIAYSSVNQKEEPKVAETLKPDIVSIFLYEGTKCFAVLDAKYYKVIFSPELKGQPGIGDITKQYLYNLAYKDFIEKHDFDRVCNCFLMPVDGNEFVKRGYANLEILQFFNFGKPNEKKHYKDEIDIILMPAEEMFNLYLSGKEWDDNFRTRVLGLIVDTFSKYGEKR